MNRSKGRGRLGLAVAGLVVMMGVLLTSPRPVLAGSGGGYECGQPCFYDEPCPENTPVRCHCAYQAWICIKA